MLQKNLIFITFYYIYSKLLMILFQINNLCWKQHSFDKPCWLYFMPKNYITVLFRQFMKTLNQFFYMSRENQNLETWVLVWFEQLKELKQFWDAFTGWYFNKWKLCQKCKISCLMKTTRCSHIIFTWVSSGMKQLIEIVFNSCTASIFPALEIKKPVLVNKILWYYE